MPKEPKKGIELLRMAVRLFNNCNETFNEGFTAAELLQIAACYQECGWDFTPDEWHERQVNEATKGIVPQWDDQERPIFDDPNPKMAQPR